MKLLLSFLFISSLLMAQSPKAITVTPYIGAFNTLRSTLSLGENLGPDVTYKGISPIGIRSTYFVRENVSVGVDLIWGTSTAMFTRIDTAFIDNQWQYVNNNYEITKSRLRPQIRVNKHFSKSADLDQYVGFAMGGNKRWRKEYVNNVLVSKEVTSAVPLSLRLCYGIHYYPTYHIGIGGEVGLGGPLLQASFTWKF